MGILLSGSQTQQITSMCDLYKIQTQTKPIYDERTVVTLGEGDQIITRKGHQRSFFLEWRYIDIQH